MTGPMRLEDGSVFATFVSICATILRPTLHESRERLPAPWRELGAGQFRGAAACHLPIEIPLSLEYMEGNVDLNAARQIQRYRTNDWLQPAMEVFDERAANVDVPTSDIVRPSEVELCYHGYCEGIILSFILSSHRCERRGAASSIEITVWRANECQDRGCSSLFSSTARRREGTRSCRVWSLSCKGVRVGERWCHAVG